jgi:hypothetical protein
MRPYDLFMLALCLWALAILAAGVFVRWTDATGRVLAYADDLVCGLFLVDFFVSDPPVAGSHQHHGRTRSRRSKL